MKRWLWFCCLALLINLALAGDDSEDNSAEQLMVLMEFIAGWERAGNDWVDPVSLESAVGTESNSNGQRDEEESDYE